jgi:chromosome segregation ATPase
MAAPPRRRSKPRPSARQSPELTEALERLSLSVEALEQKCHNNARELETQLRRFAEVQHELDSLKETVNALQKKPR